MRRAAAVLVVCWAAGLALAILARPCWLGSPGKIPERATVARPVAGPALNGRPSPETAALAAANGVGGRVGATASLDDCRPQLVSVDWDGPDHATVELDCAATLALAGGGRLGVARTWRISVAVHAGRWVTVGMGP